MVLPALGLLGAALCAQDITVNPNRPSFANPATTTMPGVAELEFGLQRTLQPDGSRSDYQPTLLKLGLTEDFELRLGWNGWERDEDPSGAAVTGPTDPNFGFTWRLLRQEPFGADVALTYAHKLPRASVLKGIGSGAPDDTLGVLASKDFGPLHADFNVLETWVGQPGAGRLRQPAAALALTHPLAGPWSMGAEVYAIGGGAAGPRTVSTLWNLAYQVSPRLVLDAGFDRGLNQDAPRWNCFAGLTWGIGRFMGRP
ncbi:MAG TPA: hypothetical protein VJ600_06330 [Holophagaceae bacterium]|nr:hypothetical protein [Holophagaceae bacterium]